MKSSQDISNQIRSQLKLTDPDFSAEPLTPERKIIDTVAEVIAGSQADQYTLQYQFDIDSKIGSDLDKFVALFGFARQGGVRATGLVTFYTSSVVDQNLFIPVGTEISTSSSSITSSTLFSTTSSTTILAGTDSATTTIQAVNVGSAGNVPSGYITTYAGAQQTQVSYCSNSLPTSNGRDAESDEEFRIRFKNTVLRNIAGTKDQFLSIALSSQYTNKAVILGAADLFRETVEFPVVASGTSVAISQIPYSKYTYDFDYYVSQDSSGEDVFFNPGTDYQLTRTYLSDTSKGTVAPAITLLNPQPDKDFGQDHFVVFQHTYNSVHSRNIPASGILNYIDIYVDGENPIAVSESASIPISSGSGNQLMTTVTGSTYFVGNFRVKKTLQTPSSGYLYQKLLWQPITLLPETISIGNSHYKNGSDFILVEDITTNRGSKFSRDGIAWNPSAWQQISAMPTASGIFTVDYEFNNLPLYLNEICDQYKQVTTDVLIHASNKRYFIVNLTIIYTSGYSSASVDANIRTALSNYFSSLNFGDVIQFSDILQIAHNTNGVDNVRFSTLADRASYVGLQEVNEDGDIISTYSTDIALNDIDSPNLYDLYPTRLAQNTWSSGV